MNEKNKIYDDKMTKTINNLDGELATIRAGRANWISWQLITTEHQHRSSR